MRRRLALIRRLPPRVVVQRALGLAHRLAAAALADRRDLGAPTHGPEPAAATPVPTLPGALTPGVLEPARSVILALAARHCRHEFDLLGSGWTEVAHGVPCRGLGGHRYDGGPAVIADPDGTWLAGRINDSNLARSRALWRRVTPGYRPIDWQRDFKSGFRWDERRTARRQKIGHLPGVDVKVPWELARMQHLPLLMMAAALDPAGRWATEVGDQILDFLAQNPPRFGINWFCTMDVAIRGAGWALTAMLARRLGVDLGDRVGPALEAGLRDHARHVLQHLELFPEGHGNHYLADVCGLAFIAAALPEGSETTAWLAFAQQELVRETRRQFHPDGANFEASTAYHRLAAEMVVFATALLHGLPAHRRAAIAGADPHRVATRPRRPLERPVAKLDETHFRRIAGMAAFLAAVTKPSGRIAQIGDNDSGRFFRLHPICDAGLDEETLDHRPTIAAAAMLSGQHDMLAAAGTGWVDVPVIAALAPTSPGVMRPEPCRSAHAPATPLAPGTPVRTIEIVAPGGDLRAGLSCAGFPGFGLWTWRSERLFMTLRCGPVGHEGRGAHDHNDQLSLELAIDGADWIVDPGSYLYTADRAARDAYRSVAAHFAPRLPGREPASLQLGDFWLGREAEGTCLRFDAGGFVGEHRGYGTILRRSVEIGTDTITVRDEGVAPADAGTIRCTGPEELHRRFPPAVPFSPGYGRRAGA